ncbi:MAG: cyclodeaminase/cyclohydrolase family protein [Firmicutes bacterium]|nr:cyclodeaminase/cyclohydrolase family protein [Bacillota bacterium]
MFRDKTIRDFTDELASKAPVPGGGGASALAGAVGIALGNMVGSLTVGKKKYADVEDDLRSLMKRAEVLRKELLECIDEDAACFEPLAAAYSLPAETDEEKAEKDKVMEQALETACAGPFSIMEKVCEAIGIIEEFAEKGSRLAVSDAGAGAALCCAALKGASLNIYINTKMMKDREKAAAFEEKADKLSEEGSAKADEIFEKVKDSIRE